MRVHNISLLRTTINIVPLVMLLPNETMQVTKIFWCFQRDNFFLRPNDSFSHNSFSCFDFFRMWLRWWEQSVWCSQWTVCVPSKHHWSHLQPMQSHILVMEWDCWLSGNDFNIILQCLYWNHEQHGKIPPFLWAG